MASERATKSITLLQEEATSEGEHSLRRAKGTAGGTYDLLASGDNFAVVVGDDAAQVAEHISSRTDREAAHSADRLIEVPIVGDR